MEKYSFSPCVIHSFLITKFLQDFDYYDRRYDDADLFERRYSGMRGGNRDYPPGGMRGGRDMGPMPPMPRNGGGARMDSMFSRRSPPSRGMRGFG